MPSSIREQTPPALRAAALGANCARATLLHVEPSSLTIRGQW